MKLGCISWSHRAVFSAGAMDLDSWIRHCARDARLDGVEIWSDHLTSLDGEYLDGISAHARAEGLDLYSVAWRCEYGDFSEAVVSNVKETLRSWFAATDRLGATVLRVSIRGEDLQGSAHKHIVFQSLKDVIDEGNYPRIKVGIENSEPGAVATIDDMRWMKYLSDGALGLVLDNGNILDKSTVYDFMERALPFAIGVHLKFFEVDAVGADQDYDYARIMHLVKSSGYDGYLSIEYQGRPHNAELASEDVPKIAGYLRSQLGTVEAVPSPS